MKGIVKWYRRNLGYGYITADDGTDYFVHQTQIEVQGYRSLARGEAVDFIPGIDRNHGNRPWATQVTTVQKQRQ